MQGAATFLQVLEIRANADGLVLNKPTVPGTLEFTYHRLSSRCHKRQSPPPRESVFCKHFPSTIPSVPTFSHARRGQVLPTRSNERTGDPRVRDWGLLATLSDSTICQLALTPPRDLEGKGAAGAGQRPREGLALLLRLGKRRSIEPRRWRGVSQGLACTPAAGLVGAVVRLGASSDAASASSALCGKAHAHTGRSSHDQNVLQLPVRPVAG
jgi:hypothetical protein